MYLGICEFVQPELRVQETSYIYPMSNPNQSSHTLVRLTIPRIQYTIVYQSLEAESERAPNKSRSLPFTAKTDAPDDDESPVVRQRARERRHALFHATAVPRLARAF